MKYAEHSQRCGIGAWICLVMVSLLSCDRTANSTAVREDGSPKPSVNVSIPLAEPTSKNPVSVGAALSPKKVSPGETVTFVVRAKTAPSWHINAVDRRSEMSIPTTLALELPAGFEASGDWVVPDSKEYSVVGITSYICEGELTFQRSLRVPANGQPGRFQVTCKFGYQACDASICLAPTKVDVVAMAEIVKPE